MLKKRIFFFYFKDYEEKKIKWEKNQSTGEKKAEINGKIVLNLTL